MIDPRKQAYLEAMGFDVWVVRSSPATRDRLALAPGQGSTLLVCARAGDRETDLAADIARAVGDDPTWGWPDPTGLPDAPTLEQAIENGLITRVVVFGRETARQLLGADVPAVLKSSKVAVVADLDELATHGTAKQALWKLLDPGEAGRVDG
jgi:hypothetical protein